MCGRFTLSAPGAQIVSLFDLDPVPGVDLAPRYNVAPTQPVPAVRCSAAHPGKRELVRLRWGLVPRWVKDRSACDLFNARAETLATKPSFRDSFRSRRCLIPADGFYEWRHSARGRKQPFYIFQPGHELFAFAGLWDRWRGPGGEVLESCAIVTTAANQLVAPLHDRMPLILSPADYARWLDPRLTHDEDLKPLLRPFPSEEMALYPVGPAVNDARFDDPRCIEKVAEARREPTLWGE